MTLKELHKKIPLIVKRVSVSAFAIATAVGTYGVVAGDPVFTKIGGIAMMISVGLPPLFGLKSPKDETTN